MSTVLEILETMDYGPAPESNSHVKAWLAIHKDGFGHFIGGSFVGSSSKILMDVFNPHDNSILGRVAQEIGRAHV